MSVEIACPSCAARLDLPESLLGTQVRCVSCQTAFLAPGLMDGPATLSASDSSKPATVDLPLQQNAVEIKLELDSEPAAEPAMPLPPVPLPAGAREIPPSEAGPQGQHEKPPELNICPSCGALVRRDMRRCYRCGERLSRVGWPETEEDRLRRQPSRRDCEPHRGGLVLALGIMGLIFFSFCGPVGMVLSISAWVMGRTDLARMREGTMDREGEPNTRIGMICGIVGVPLNALWLIGCAAFWVFLVPEMDRPGPRPVQPNFGAPPQDWRNKKW